jgi:hypothetical protein
MPASKYIRQKKPTCSSKNKIPSGSSLEFSKSNHPFGEDSGPKEDDHDHSDDEDDCCGGGTAPLVSCDGTDDDNADMDDTYIVPTFIKFALCALFWGAIVYYLHFHESTTVSSEKEMNALIEWYIYVFQTVSTWGGAIIGLILMSSVVRAVWFKEGGEFI